MVVEAKEMVLPVRSSVTELRSSEKTKKGRPGVFITDIIWNSTRKRSDQRNVFWCPCGRHKVEQYESRHTERPVQHECSCGNERFVKAGHSIPIYAYFEENEKFVKLCFGVQHYTVTGLNNEWHYSKEACDRMKPVSYQSKFKIITNKETKMTYFFNQKTRNIRNISRSHDFKDNNYLYNMLVFHDQFSKEVQKWADFFFSRVPEYVKKEWCISDRKLHDFNVLKAVRLYAYPYLAHFGRATTFYPSDQKERETARKAGGKIDLYRIKLPMATKRIIREMEERPNLYKDIEFYAMIDNKEALYNAITLNGKHPRRQNLDLVFPSRAFTKRLKQQFIKWVGGQQAFDRQMSRCRHSVGLCQDSLRMLKEIDAALMRMTGQEKEEFVLKHLEPIRGKRIMEIHNGFMKALRFITQRDEPIELTKKEKNRYNRSYGDLHFMAPERTHELIRTGTTMSICVGSYSMSAVKRELTIVNLYDSGNTPLLCIEIRKNAIVQVKKKYNHRLDRSEEKDKELIAAFTRWIKETGLSVETMDFSLNPNKKSNELNQNYAMLF